MGQGRINRLQSAALIQTQQVPAACLEVCVLCERAIPLAFQDAHHMVPKSRGGVSTAFMHRVCHKQIHALFTETVLARRYSTVEALRAHPEMAKFIVWVKEKPIDFNPPTRKSRHKGRLFPSLFQPSN